MTDKNMKNKSTGEVNFLATYILYSIKGETQLVS